MTARRQICDLNFTLHTHTHKPMYTSPAPHLPKQPSSLLQPGDDSGPCNGKGALHIFLHFGIGVTHLGNISRTTITANRKIRYMTMENHLGRGGEGRREEGLRMGWDRTDEAPRLPGVHAHALTGSLCTAHSRPQQSIRRHRHLQPQRGFVNR